MPLPRRLGWLVILAGIGVAVLLLLRSCGSAPADAESVVFVVNRNSEANAVAAKLHRQDYAQGRWFLDLAMLLHGGYGRVQPGGYRLSPGMGSWTLASTLTADPSLRWVTIPEGLRREQIAQRLAKALGWDAAKERRFLEIGIQTPYDLTEGFYFPDTYLIPTDESEEKVLKRFINRFNEAFDPFFQPLKEANIKYDTAIKLASVLQREAAGTSDMPLIAGILWNRLLIKMPLEVDATLQYIRASEKCAILPAEAGGPNSETNDSPSSNASQPASSCEGWWAPVNVADKQIDSPFNTYLYPGLPPQPISNPGTDAIEAVLHPQETKCLFYLHADDRSIHCAETYEGHVENIENYLR